MALNWIFWKKSIFTSGIIGLTITPIVVVNQYSSSSPNQATSLFKENLSYLTGKYAEEFGIPDLAKEVLQMTDMKDSLEEILAKDLALTVVERSAFFADKYKWMVKEEQENHDKEFQKYPKEDAGKFYDLKGGNRQDMKKRELSEKAYEKFKNEILSFDPNHFTINKNKDENNFVSYKAHISKKIIEDKNNWEKIGFFSREDFKQQSDPNFFKHKFDFINFAHKKWFQEVKPFFVWMSLWKHKSNSRQSEINKIWDSEKIGKNISSPSYSFPLFDEQTTLKKFQNFFKNIVSAYEKNSTIYIPRGYTEDSSTSIMVEGKNMYENLYIKFAAAANYKYQKKLKNNNKDDNNLINKREKTENVQGYKQPFELFMFSSSNNPKSSRIKVFQNIFKEENYKTKNEIADLVEIKDTPWTFIRNKAGIHAIAVDIENKNDESITKDEEYKYFQFRSLQVLYKNHLNLNGVLDLKIDDIFRPFKDYLTKNFNRFIVEYMLSKDNFFSFEVNSFLKDSKNFFEAGQELEKIKNMYQRKIKLRESLINTYATQKWNIDDNNKFKHSDPELGMAGMIPWEIDSNYDEAKKDLSNIFKKLESIYDEENVKENLQETYKKSLKKYQTEAENFTNKLKLNIDLSSSSRYSDRIFSNNYYINRINDKFLDQPQLFNEFLFKYISKSDYLQKSILKPQESGGFVNVKDNWTVKVPEQHKSNNDEETVIDDTKQGNESNIKKIFGALDEKIKTNFYSKVLFSKESSNPWDAAKYNGLILGENKNTKEHLQKTAELAFENEMMFGDGKYRNQYYKFLTSLSYLIYNNFENLISYLKSNLSREKDAYIIFSSYSLSKNEVNLPSKNWNNPFLNPQKYDQEDYGKKVENIYKYFSSVNFQDKKNKIPQNFIYHGFYKGDNIDELNIPSIYLENFKSPYLYRYGETLASMNNYVLEIKTNEEFKKVVHDIEQAVKDTKTNDWISNLKLDTIYISDKGKKTIKTLTLQEKKNLLSAYLNNVKVEINNSSIDKDKYSKVFLTDPDKNFNSINSTHKEKKSNEENYEEKISSQSFKKIEEVKDKENKNGAFKLFQINIENVSSWEKFKKYVNENLNSDIFWSWIINLATTNSIQDLAMKDINNNSKKIKSFDKRWFDVGDKKFIGN